MDGSCSWLPSRAPVIAAFSSHPSTSLLVTRFSSALDVPACISPSCWETCWLLLTPRTSTPLWLPPDCLLCLPAARWPPNSVQSSSSASWRGSPMSVPFGPPAAAFWPASETSRPFRHLRSFLPSWHAVCLPHSSQHPNGLQTRSKASAQQASTLRLC